MENHLGKYRKEKANTLPKAFITPTESCILKWSGYIPMLNGNTRFQQVDKPEFSNSTGIIPSIPPQSIKGIN
ncbi:hypothetical protein CJF42_16010 [Pseudoalteromonas sp. NBT06-2]|nr:hypothetical protein CJF42_16010 [Pseudoalteromonas sp. NBT06-2]